MEWVGDDDCILLAPDRESGRVQDVPDDTCVTDLLAAGKLGARTQ